MKDRRVRYSDEQLSELVKIATERLGLDAVIDAADAVPGDPFGHDYVIIPEATGMALGEHKSEGSAVQAAASLAERAFTSVRVAKVITKIERGSFQNSARGRPEMTQRRFAKNYAIITLCVMLISVIVILTATHDKSAILPSKIEFVVLDDGTRCFIADRRAIECNELRKD